MFLFSFLVSLRSSCSSIFFLPSLSAFTSPVPFLSYDLCVYIPSPAFYLIVSVFTFFGLWFLYPKLLRLLFAVLFFPYYVPSRVFVCTSVALYARCVCIIIIIIIIESLSISDGLSLLSCYYYVQ
jgi:hypothetical protein